MPFQTKIDEDENKPDLMLMRLVGVYDMRNCEDNHNFQRYV